MQTSFLTESGGINPMAERWAAADRCLERAEREVANWGDLAMTFLRKYAAEHERVFAEDVTAASIAWGMVPPTDSRAWGPIVAQAVREGWLVDDKATRRRKNGCLAANYRSMVRA